MLAAVFVVLAFLLHWFWPGFAPCWSQSLNADCCAAKRTPAANSSCISYAMRSVPKATGDAHRRCRAPVLCAGRATDTSGRIARVSLEPIWDWIGRDLIPVEAKALSHDINRALLDDDRVKAEQLTRALHDRALQRIREAMTAVAGDDATRRRLAVQVGTLRVLDDVVALAGILGCRDLLADLARRLPNHMRSLRTRTDRFD